MKKTAHKLRPGDYWRMGEHESWFADMAANGLHLKKMGIYFAKFVKGEPKKMRYRIDVSPKKKIHQEQIQLYAENGWSYVTRYQYFHVFSSPEELDAPELYVDPAEQANTLKELERKLTSNAVIVVLGAILMFGLLLPTWLLDGTPTFALVKGHAIQQTMLAAFFGYMAYFSLRASRSIRALRRNLSAGKPIDHHAPWKKQFRWNSLSPLLFTVFVGVGVIFSFTQLVKMDTKTLPESSPDLPIVRLADVEKNPDLMREEPSYVSNDVDWGNRYSYDWSPVAPLQYDTDEHGVVPGKLWADGSGVYSPSIHTQVYQLRLPSLSDHLISDLVERYRYEERKEDFVEREHPDLDLLIVHVEGDMKKVFASKGKAVVYVRYFGYADINSVIENIVEKITLISD